MVLTDEEFLKKHYAAPTVLEKIKLAIKEDRYTISERTDKPNFSEAYLDPILLLPPNYPVHSKAKTSEEPGMGTVHTMEYVSKIMGRELRIYFKGFFKVDGMLELKIQSLRENLRIVK